MAQQQKGKHHKRKKNWHRGRVESRGFNRAMRKFPKEPLTGSEAIVYDGEPIPLKKGSGGKYRRIKT